MMAVRWLGAALLVLLLAGAAVEAVKLSTVESAGAASARRRNLEKRIRRTAFGRTMLRTVKAQMRGGASAKSFNRVQDFVDQVFKRVSQEQAVEAATHAAHIDQCKIQISRMLAVTQAKDTEFRKMNATVFEQKRDMMRLPHEIAQLQAKIKETTAQLQHTNARIAQFKEERTATYEAYKIKFAEARDLVKVVERILRRLNLFFPQADASSLLEAGSKLAPDLALRFKQEYTDASEADMHRFSAVVQALEASIYANKHTDDIRNLLQLIDRQLRKYMRNLNRGQKQAVQSNKVKLELSESDKEDFEGFISSTNETIGEYKARLTEVNAVIDSNQEELRLSRRNLDSVKEQLQSRTQACRAIVVEDRKAAAFRLEQLKTLEALRIVAARHVGEEKLALERQARAAAEARQAAIEAARSQLGVAHQKLHEAAEQMVRQRENVTVVNGTVITEKCEVCELLGMVPEPTKPPVDPNAANKANQNNVADNKADNNTPKETAKPTPAPTQPPPPPELKYTCKDKLEELKKAGQPIKSGVYELQTPGSHRSFKVYCDMKRDGGGWMLAFKQSFFKSGSVSYNSSLIGSPKLGDDWNKLQSTKGSLFDYGKPTEFMFQSHTYRTNWFVTKNLNTFQRWDVQDTSRYCLYRAYSQDTGFRVSPKWDYGKMNLWPDAVVQLMIEPHPSVSSIVIGKFKAKQHPPQCMAPQCSDERHGRYNGNCQDGAKGEGNWLVYVR